MAQIILISGGGRSGQRSFAEEFALKIWTALLISGNGAKALDEENERPA